MSILAASPGSIGTTYPCCLSSDAVVKLSQNPLRYMLLRSRRHEVRLVAVFVALLVIYLAVAYFFHAPRGYYGTLAEPRFADPWFERSETILNGGLLYRDVFTTTPPLTNYLLLPPAIFSSLFGDVNPWATLSFMLYFSLFNLFAAFVLLYMADDRDEGFYAALFFLLNPLTFGNTVLRRQDESIVVFFVAVALALYLKRRHLAAAVGIGAAMLVKLTGAMILPVVFLHSRKWLYLVIPFLVFFLVLAPFLVAAGSDAIFWDVSRGGTEHPFQFRGVSLGSLWNRFHIESNTAPLSVLSIVFTVGVAATLLALSQKSFGFLEDVSILIAVVLLLSPKLHTGYFSFLALTMAPLLKRYRLQWTYMTFGAVAIVADFYKWPIVDFPMAFTLMVVVSLLLLFALLRIIRASTASPLEEATGSHV